MSLSLDDGQDQLELVQGQLVFKQGDTCENMYIVKSGEVVCFSSNKGQIVPIYTAVTEEFIGDESSIAKEEYSYNAVATENTVLIKVPTSNIKSFFKDGPKWMSNLFSHLSEKIIETEHLISEHVIRDPLLNKGKDLAPEKLQMLTKALKS